MNADKTANRATVEERAAQGLLDVYVIVRVPDGRTLIEVDDIQAGILTNALIENLQLTETGIYEIEVRAWENQSDGQYTLTIERAPTVIPTP